MHPFRTPSSRSKRYGSIPSSPPPFMPLQKCTLTVSKTCVLDVNWVDICIWALGLLSSRDFGTYFTHPQSCPAKRSVHPIPPRKLHSWTSPSTPGATLKREIYEQGMCSCVIAIYNPVTRCTMFRATSISIESSAADRRSRYAALEQEGKGPEQV